MTVEADERDLPSRVGVAVESSGLDIEDSDPVGMEAETSACSVPVGALVGRLRVVGGVGVPMRGDSEEAVVGQLEATGEAVGELRESLDGDAETFGPEPVAQIGRR